MNKQISMSALNDELAQITTRKKEFLNRLERIVPWQQWVEIIQPYYYRGIRGNKPYDLERMLRIHVLQEIYRLSDVAIVSEVIDSRAFAEFCGVDSSNQIPDSITVGRFRKLLKRNELEQKLFANIQFHAQENGLSLKQGSILEPSLSGSSR